MKEKKNPKKIWLDNQMNTIKENQRLTSHPPLKICNCECRKPEIPTCQWCLNCNHAR